MKTYDEIYNSMAEKYEELTGIMPDECSDLGIRLRVLAGEIYSSAVNLSWLKRQMFFSTADGEYLDLHAAERGIERRKASKAFGEVRFFCVQPAEADISIPKGTVVACPLSLLRFETTEDAFIAKSKNSVSVKAQSIEEGRKFNVSENTVTVMVTPPSGVDGVTNTKVFTGGCDEENDESLRGRISSSFRFPVNSTNCAYYKSVAESIRGVGSASVAPRVRGAGTVDIYIASEGTKASDETVAQVQKLMDEYREVNVDVKVSSAEPSPVNLYFSIKVADGYDFEEVKERCLQILREKIACCGVGSEVLLCQVSEWVYHVDGVKALSIFPGVNADYRFQKDRFPVEGDFSITEAAV